MYIELKNKIIFYFQLLTDRRSTKRQKTRKSRWKKNEKIDWPHQVGLAKACKSLPQVCTLPHLVLAIYVFFWWFRCAFDYITLKLLFCGRTCRTTQRWCLSPDVTVLNFLFYTTRTICLSKPSTRVAKCSASLRALLRPCANVVFNFKYISRKTTPWGVYF